MTSNIIGSHSSFSIVIAEDDEDDYLLTLEALNEADSKADIIWVKDGEELLDYLFSTSIEENGNNIPLPSVILLDLNMPKKDGREALKEIKNHRKFCSIPVVIFTTSNADSDVCLSYDLGVNSFIQKPIRFNQLVALIKSFSQYWFNIVTLPK